MSSINLWKEEIHPLSNYPEALVEVDICSVKVPFSLSKVQNDSASLSVFQTVFKSATPYFHQHGKEWAACGVLGEFTQIYDITGFLQSRTLSSEEGTDVAKQQVVDEKTWCKSVLPGQLNTGTGQFV